MLISDDISYFLLVLSKSDGVHLSPSETIHEPLRGMH